MVFAKSVKKKVLTFSRIQLDCKNAYKSVESESTNALTLEAFKLSLYCFNRLVNIWLKTDLKLALLKRVLTKLRLCVFKVFTNLSSLTKWLIKSRGLSNLSTHDESLVNNAKALFRATLNSELFNKVVKAPDKAEFDTLLNNGLLCFSFSNWLNRSEFNKFLSFAKVNRPYNKLFNPVLFLFTSALFRSHFAMSLNLVPRSEFTFSDNFLDNSAHVWSRLRFLSFASFKVLNAKSINSLSNWNV